MSQFKSNYDRLRYYLKTAARQNLIVQFEPSDAKRLLSFIRRPIAKKKPRV